jgi:hypothetical protein
MNARTDPDYFINNASSKTTILIQAAVSGLNLVPFFCMPEASGRISRKESQFN